MQIKKRYIDLRHPIKDVLVDFGKYAEQGLTWSMIERSYIEVLLASERQKVEAFEKELERRDLLEEAEVPMVLRVIQAGLHSLALVYHPDRGGDEVQMRALNAAVEVLKELVAQVQQPT